jgi:hypothetical protein
MRVQACAYGFLLATAFTVSAGERLTIAVSTSQDFAPATATIRVHVTPDANDRGLEFSVDSGEYYRSSWFQLDGTEAPQAVAVEVRGLPGGNYQIRGALVDSTGRACAFTQTQVIVLP